MQEYFSTRSNFNGVQKHFIIPDPSQSYRCQEVLPGLWSCYLWRVILLPQRRKKQSSKVSFYCVNFLVSLTISKCIPEVSLTFSMSSWLLFWFYRFVLNTKRIKTLTMPNSRYHNLTYLFRNSKTYFKFAVDENGLWVIFASNTDDNTMVAKLNSDTFSVESIINTAYPTAKAGNAFIVCGVVYFTDDQDKRVTYAFDLKTQRPLDASFDLRTSSAILAMLSYYPNKRLIYMWDNRSVNTCKVKFKQAWK